MKTLVLGLGNPILTDDGVGVQVAETVGALLDSIHSADRMGEEHNTFNLSQSSDQGHQIDVQEASVGGLALMETMLGYDRVILIDACDQQTLAPGMMQRLSLDDLRTISPTQHSASPHDASLITAFDLGRRMGLPLPDNVVIYAIGVENVIDFCDTPTPAVAAAIPQVAATVLAEL